jgi:hypothetical protein
LRAACTFGVLVSTIMPSAAGIAQDAIGFGDPCMATRHIRQLPAMARRS